MLQPGTKRQLVTTTMMPYYYYYYTTLSSSSSTSSSVCLLRRTTGGRMLRTTTTTTRTRTSTTPPVRSINVSSSQRRPVRQQQQQRQRRGGSSGQHVVLVEEGVVVKQQEFGRRFYNNNNKNTTATRRSGYHCIPCNTTTSSSNNSIRNFITTTTRTASASGAKRMKTTTSSTTCPSSSIRRTTTTTTTRTKRIRSSRTTTITARHQHRNKATLAAEQQSSSSGSSSSEGASSSSWWSFTTLSTRRMYKFLEVFLSQPRTIPIPRWITPRHITTTLSEVLGHSSFVLVAVSYAVDDYIMLRCIAVSGSTAMLFFTYFHPHGRPLWLPFQWNALFIAINTYRIGKVLFDRYISTTLLSNELIELRDNFFFLMDKVDFYKLVRLGTVEEYKKGDVLVHQGQSNTYVRLIVNGKMRVLRDGKLNYYLEEANFISECGLHAGLMLPGAMESCCTIIADEKTRVLTWDRTEFISLLQHDTGVNKTMKAVLSWDIVRKLKAQRVLLANGGIVSENDNNNTNNNDDDDPELWAERRQLQTIHRYCAILHNLILQPQWQLCKKQLSKYRMIHDITDIQHEQALKQLGWTIIEFEQGYKNNHNNNNTENDDADDDDHAGAGGGGANDIRQQQQRQQQQYQSNKSSLRLYAHNLYLRLFGE